MRAPGASSHAGPGGPDEGGALEALRHRIEAVDRELVEKIAERASLARRIGAVKRAASSATLDPGREAAVIRRAVETARGHGLPEEPVRELFWTLVGLCRAAQMEDR